MKSIIVLLGLLFLPVSLYASEEEVSKLLLSEIMFYRMQDDNFDAITSYLNSAESESLKLNANNQAYIASIYLNYDLHSQVSNMLDLLIKNDSPLIRDTSWFYLGKLHYRNKRVKSAVETFSKIEGQLSPADQELKHIMYGVMAINDGRNEIAITELKKVSAQSVLSPFVKYNIAIAQIRLDKNTDVFAQTLVGLAESLKKDQAQSYVFADQIYTTLGYVLLQNKEYEKAIEAFRKVTLDGHLATRALQGMIYCLAEMQQYTKALNLSLQLIKMTIGNEAIHHAYIVIPYILQKLNDTEKAMAFYQHAVEYFGQQRVDLRRYINKTKQGEFDAYLLELKKIINVDDWLKDEEMARLFRFVSTLDEWRDAVYKYNEMTYLKKRLEDTFYKLVVIEQDVQSENKQRYKKSLAAIENDKKQVENSIRWHQKYARHFVIAALQKQYDDVTDYLAQARFALAQFYDEQEQAEKQLALEALKSAERANTESANDPVNTGDMPVENIAPETQKEQPARKKQK